MGNASLTQRALADALKSFRFYLASEEDPKIKADELEIYKKVRIVVRTSFL